MEIALNLLQALTEKGERLGCKFGGIAGMTGAGASHPEGSELKYHDEKGQPVMDGHQEKKLKKDIVRFCESITICHTDKATVGDLFEEFSSKYVSMLNKVYKKMKHKDCNWVNSAQSVLTLPIRAELRKDFVGWLDNVNAICFNVHEEENKEKEQVTIYFHFQAWSCFNPMEAKRLQMEAEQKEHEDKLANMNVVEDVEEVKDNIEEIVNSVE